jgi:hypothetical protein
MLVKVYLGGRVGLMQGVVNLDSTNVGCILVKQGSTFISDEEVLYLADFTDLKEFDSSNYVRKFLASTTITPDWDRDKAIFTAVNPIWLVLEDDDFPIVGMIIYMHNGAENANIPIYGYQLNTPINPGAEDYEFPFSENGISEL